MRSCIFDNWKFYLAKSVEPDYKNVDNYEWREVKLPHDWSTDYPVDPDSDTCGSGGYVVAGIGYYCRKLNVPKTDERVLLYFEGSYMNTTVYVNGIKAGKHLYGYTPFEIDITDKVNEGDNDLLVVVNNSIQPGSRWYSGSGLTRDVWLETRGPLYIARYGTYITTDITDTADSKLNVDVTLHTRAEDNNATNRVLSLGYDLVDKFGKIVCSGTKRLDNDFQKATGDAAIMSGIDGAIPEDLYELKSSLSINVANPLLWSPDAPNLYELVIKLEDGSELIEQRKEVVAFRSIEFDNRKGFILNGEQVKLNGVCLHHDGGCVGAAVPSDIWARRLRKLKEMGVNSIRCAHNPPDTALLDLCDRMGFTVMDEAFDEWNLMKAKEIGSNTHESHGYSMYFDECHEYDIKTMLYRDRNHPSVILWSIGNEIPEQIVEGGEKIAAKLREYCHTIDPSRKITLAHDQIVAEPREARQEFLEEIDVVGYNYVARWRKRAETMYDEDHEAYPHRCVIGSENPSAGYARSDYRFEYDKKNFWYKPYYSAPVAVGKLLRYTMTHDFVAGDYMWTGIDYLGEAHWPTKSTACGCLDTCGYEKDSFYFYKSIWNQEEKFAYLCPHWNLNIEEGKVIPVICYTNCEDAELFVNGKSYGVKSKGFPCYGMTEMYGHFDRYRRPANTDDLFLSWDVPYVPGKIEVVGYQDGEEVCRYQVETTGKAERIKLRSDVTELKADGRHIAQVEVSLLDDNGRIDRTACNALTYELEGDAEIIGIDNGRPDCHEQWKDTKNRTAFNGLAYCVIRAGKSVGDIRLTVESENIKPAEMLIKIVE